MIGVELACAIVMLRLEVETLALSLLPGPSQDVKPLDVLVSSSSYGCEVLNWRGDRH